MSNLAKMDGSEYGLEATKAKQISDMFKPMLDKMEELEKEHNEVVKMEITEETCAKAKEVRLKFVRVRTGTATIHKELKQFYLQGGRFVDGWKNAQLMASQGLEENLKGIEDHYLNIEKEKIVKLQETRAKEVSPYTDVIQDNLGVMLPEIWDNYIAGLKLNFETQQAAEKKAEEERIELERLHVLEQKRLNQTSRLIDYIDDYEKINFAHLSEEDYTTLVNKAIDKRTEYENKQEEIRQENERLKQEAIKKEKEAEKERIKQKELADKERAEAEKQRIELEEKARKESEERAKVEAELQAKKDAEAKRVQEDKEAQEAALSKGDKEKFEDFTNELATISSRYSFKSKKYQQTFKTITDEINRILEED